MTYGMKSAHSLSQQDLLIASIPGAAPVPARTATTRSPTICAPAGSSRGGLLSPLLLNLRTQQHRYDDMPRPVIDLGRGRVSRTGRDASCSSSARTSTAAAATDAARLRELSEELAALADQRDELEGAWLELSEELEA
jgi:hypothetical protein